MYYSSPTRKRGPFCPITAVLMAVLSFVLDILDVLDVLMSALSYLSCRYILTSTVDDVFQALAMTMLTVVALYLYIPKKTVMYVVC
jgi:hypothetical protein